VPLQLNELLARWLSRSVVALTARVRALLGADFAWCFFSFILVLDAL
jgi:hypothetical protein